MTLGARYPICLSANKRILQIFSYRLHRRRRTRDRRRLAQFHALNFRRITLPRYAGYVSSSEQHAAAIPSRCARPRACRCASRKSTKPPIRMLMPGRVYRNETISARAHCFFHQVERTDDGVSFADMKQTLLYFSREDVRRRYGNLVASSHFPFTELAFPPGWTSPANFARQRMQRVQIQPAGSRSWVAAWSIPTYCRTAASIPNATAVSPSAWASNASPWTLEG